MMNAAVEIQCADCAVARARVREGMGAFVVECVCGRVHRARVARVYQGDPDAPAPERTALDRAGHAALRAEDAEVARVRRVLAELRPDCPDPMEPPAPAAEVLEVVRVRETRAPWDVDLPRGLISGIGAQLAAAAELASRCAADVLREVDALPYDAAAVLRWMRAQGRLDKGLRGLHVDAGLHFASADQREAWRDLTARRVGAEQHGRRIVTRACEAWERRAR